MHVSIIEEQALLAVKALNQALDKWYGERDPLHKFVFRSTGEHCAVYFDETALWDSYYDREGLCRPRDEQGRFTQTILDYVVQQFNALVVSVAELGAIWKEKGA